jgi:hypothetical protein
MPNLTSTEQAKLEHSLALAHRHIWGCAQLYGLRDDYVSYDELMGIQKLLYDYLEVELKRGARLRTRPSDRTYHKNQENGHGSGSAAGKRSSGPS